MQRPSILHPIVGAVCLVLALAVAAPVAGAHGGEGKLEAVSVVPSGTTAVVTVRLTYANDAEAVSRATVTVVGDDGAGAKLDPVPMSPTQAPGEYSATVQFPSAGTWNLRVTSVNPAATLTLDQQISAEVGVTAPTAAPETTAVGSATVPRPTDTAIEPGSVPVTGSKGTATEKTSTDDSGSGAMPWIVGAVALAVVLGLGFFLSRQRRGPSET